MSICKASHMLFCPIILRLISWRALGNLSNSSTGTTFTRLFSCCLFKVKDTPVCFRFALLFDFFFLDGFLSVELLFFTGVVLPGRSAGIDDPVIFKSWRNKQIIKADVLCIEYSERFLLPYGPVLSRKREQRHDQVPQTILKKFLY